MQMYSGEDERAKARRKRDALSPVEKEATGSKLGGKFKSTVSKVQFIQKFIRTASLTQDEHAMLEDGSPAQIESPKSLRPDYLPDIAKWQTRRELSKAYFVEKDRQDQERKRQGEQS